MVYRVHGFCHKSFCRVRRLPLCRSCHFLTGIARLFSCRFSCPNVVYTLSTMLSTEDVKSLSVRQLRAELTTRGMDSAGRKSVLHDRLSAAITAEESAEEGREREEPSPMTVTDDQLAATNPARELDYHNLRTTIVSVMTETLPWLLEAQPPVPAASCYAIVPLACEPTRMLAASPPPPRLAERIRVLISATPAHDASLPFRI